MDLSFLAYFPLSNLKLYLILVRGGGGGVIPYGTDGDHGCSSEILNLTPKGDHLGVAQAFCDP